MKIKLLPMILACAVSVLLAGCAEIMEPIGNAYDAYMEKALAYPETGLYICEDCQTELIFAMKYNHRFDYILYNDGGQEGIYLGREGFHTDDSNGIADYYWDQEADVIELEILRDFKYLKKGTTHYFKAFSGKPKPTEP